METIESTNRVNIPGKEGELSMRQFLVRVNGEEYQVEVEEVRGGKRPAQVARPITPVTPPATLTQKPKPSANAEDSNIVAPMPGTILAIKFKVGDKVNPGDTVVILEAMKLENNLTAMASGTVKVISTSEGASVNPGDLLVEIA